MEVHFTFALRFHVHINVELFLHVSVHLCLFQLWLLCGGNYWVSDCISVMRNDSRAYHELRRSESKKAKLEELSSNISDRSKAKGTGKLSDSLPGDGSEVSGNYFIDIFAFFACLHSSLFLNSQLS